MSFTSIQLLYILVYLVAVQYLYTHLILPFIRYLRCSPDMRRKEKFNFLQIPRLIKSYFPVQSPKVAVFGPGLDSDTSVIVRKMLNTHENEVFCNKGPFPAMFPGSKCNIDQQLSEPMEVTEIQAVVLPCMYIITSTADKFQS